MVDCLFCLFVSFLVQVRRKRTSLLEENSRRGKKGLRGIILKEKGFAQGKKGEKGVQKRLFLRGERGKFPILYKKSSIYD